MKVGLVLEGGAMRGMYTAGVLDVFLDNNIKIDGIIGVSAGALFGINYCSKQKGRVLRYNKKFIKDKNYMGIYPLIKTGNVVNKQLAFYDIPLKYDKLDFDEFNKSNVDFYVTVTNVDTGEAEYVKVEDVQRQTELFRATGAMPFVSEIVEYDGNKYLDGALADSIPLDKCIEMGYDKIIVVLTKPVNYRKKKMPFGVAKFKYGEYPNLVNAINTRYIRYNETMAKLENMERDKEIFVLRPSTKVKMGRIEKDENKLQEMYDLGVSDCKNNLNNLISFINN